MTTSGTELMARAKAAGTAGVSPITISRATLSGELAFVVHGKQRRYREEEVLRFALRRAGATDWAYPPSLPEPMILNPTDTRDLLATLRDTGGVFTPWPGSEGQPPAAAAILRWLISTRRLLPELNGDVEVENVSNHVALRATGVIASERDIAGPSKEDAVAPLRELLLSRPHLRSEIIAAAIHEGWSGADVAVAANVSRQWVHVISRTADPTVVETLTVPSPPVATPTASTAAVAPEDRVTQLIGGTDAVRDLRERWETLGDVPEFWDHTGPLVVERGVPVRTLARMLGVNGDLFSNRMRRWKSPGRGSARATIG